MGALPRPLRFGDFEIDAARSRLTRDGRAVKIQPQPLRVLTALVERAGDVVSREDLRRSIWDSATFVEFDQGLNFCIRQIRVALEDDAVNPTFLETVKKQGYRFIGTVTVPQSQPPEPRPEAARARWPLRTIAASIAIAALGGGAIWWSSRLMRARETSAAAAPALEQITDFADSAVAPALSRDGRLLAFIRGNRDFLTPDQIYVKILPNGEATRLTDDPRMKYGLAFSPDGTEIAYTVMEHTGWSTYAVPVLGGEPRLVLSNAAGLSWLDRDHLIFSEVKQGQHMGVVTAPENRASARELYFPAHERGMAHLAVPSPDRTTAIVVEMDEQGGWMPCRLISLTGGFESRRVGPPGACFSAAWSPDGAYAYFSAAVNGERHLWRQRMATGAPEQITTGMTSETGLAVDPDGRSLVTSMGVGESTLWMHDASGERQLSSEGRILDIGSYRAAGQYVHYVTDRETGSGHRELRRLHLATGRSETLLAGEAVGEFDISPDGTHAVYVTETRAGTQISIAPLDRSAPPGVIGAIGDRSPFYGPDGDVFFCFTEGTFNYLGRMHADGTDRRKVVPYPVSNVTGISPAGRWVMAIAPVLDQSAVGIMAIPVEGGDPVRVCEIYCRVTWSADDKFLYVSMEEPSLTSPGRSLAIPVGPHETLPAFPHDGLPPRSPASAMPGATSVPRAGMLVADATTFFYVNVGEHRNLFRIALPH
jgi:DNA-binding winged helix-turn-helix (wHTH) protein/Tol biopolymer transport system component